MLIKIKKRIFKIRNCNNTDYWFVYGITKNNMHSFFLKHWGGWNPKVFRETFNKKNIKFKIVEYKTKRIAYSALRIEKKHTYIDNIQITTLMRGKGIGECLLKQMEKETKRHKLKKIRLKVFKDNTAKNFYKKLSYKKIKDEKSAVILEKNL